MKFLKYVSLASIVIALCLGVGVSAKTKIVPKVYLFGFAASFNDSIVYFTDIQDIDSAFIDNKNNFLLSRDNYSYQLRDYLQTQNMHNRTCVTMFGFKKDKVEKTYIKMKRKYTSKNKFDVRLINSSKFRYQRIDLNVQVVDSTMLANEKKQKEEKKMKAKMEKGKRPEGDSNGQPDEKGRMKGNQMNGMGENM
jgi:hypothetical protein